MSQYFPKPYRSFDGNINVQVDLSNYATKTGLKNATWIDTSNFTLKSNLASLKTVVGKQGKEVKTCSCWFKQTKWCGKKWSCQKVLYNKLAAKANNIDTSEFVLNTKKNKQTKILLILGDLFKKTDHNSKISEIESKIPGISGLATVFCIDCSWK